MGQLTFTISPSNASISSLFRSSWPTTNFTYNIHPIAIPLKFKIRSYLSPQTPKPARTTSAATNSRASPIPARDRVIDFGRYGGKMLGSLPSAYLKWMSKKLRGGDTLEWAVLADEVLEDPVYRDRIEWEAADRILTGDNASHYAQGNDRDAVTELLEVSERFGWDFEDKIGWGKIDFGLLGTSKGGRIPRLGAGRANAEIGGLKREKNRGEEEVGGEKRRERRERVRRLRGSASGGRAAEGTVVKRREEEEDDGGSLSPADGSAVRNPFPGREALLKKALNRQRL